LNRPIRKYLNLKYKSRLNPELGFFVTNQF
jgi:hypothetical protein